MGKESGGEDHWVEHVNLKEMPFHLSEGSKVKGARRPGRAWFIMVIRVDGGSNPPWTVFEHQ